LETPFSSIIPADLFLVATDSPWPWTSLLFAGNDGFSFRLPGSIMMEVAALVPPDASVPGREETRQSDMIPLIYHPKYNITVFGLERLHPFDGLKYRRIHDALIADGYRKAGDFVRPEAVSRADLSRVHTPEYLRSLRRSRVLAEILGVPVLARLPAAFIDWRVLLPMHYATGGTTLACRMALDSGLAINLAGGYHHAADSWGDGFCVYADIPLAAATLHAEGLVQRILVVDLDAHQGNGTAATIHRWPWASILDVYENDLFPMLKQPEDFPIPAGLEGSEYLVIVEESLPRVLDTVNPDLVIYNAGSDPFVDDPLTRLRLTRDDLARRDLLVATMARERGIPLAMVLSGGYARESWRVHADGIEAILGRFDSGVSTPAVGGPGGIRERRGRVCEKISGSVWDGSSRTSSR
jgi:histone deacetylase 11